MLFQPLNEQEVLNLLPEGEYDFHVIDAEDTRSRAGSEMIKLTLTITDKNGKARTVFDYLLPALMYKVKHFSDASGLEEKYESGGYSAGDCIGKRGRLKLVIDQPTNSNYPPKNVVKDYLKNGTKTEDKQPAENNFIDDPLPF